MPLRLTLKPGERVIIGGAVIRNGNGRSEFLVENETPVLRESDILSPSDVHTACERIYLALQLVYVDPDRREQHLDSLGALLGDVLEAAPSLTPLVEEVVQHARENRLYQALKSARELIRREKELLKHVS